MKVLITGGCGFVGSNLAISIKKNFLNSDVICFDNLSRRGSELNLKKILTYGVNFIHGDVRIKTDFDKVPKVDIVIDAAAEPSVLAGEVNGELENLMETNLLGTINTLYYVKKHDSSFIFLSTSRVYPYDKLEKINLDNHKNSFIINENQSILGINSNGISEKFPLEGIRTLYGATKLCSEYLIKEFAHNFNIPCVINRCGVISGPFQMGKIDQGVIVLWMAKHYWKGNLSFIGYGGKGHQVRDVLHINDLYNLIEWQIKNINLHKSNIFNVGGGNKNAISLFQLTEICKKITGNKIVIDSKLDSRPGDIPLYITDNSKIINFSGWKPEKSIVDILTEINKWIKNDEVFLKSILQ